jgi:hypothetical protein
MMGGLWSSDSSSHNKMSDYPNLVIPTKFESNFALSDGSQGNDLLEAFAFTSDKVDNIYNWDPSASTFELCFQERGVAYGETDTSQQQAKLCLSNLPGTVDFKLAFDSTPTCRWGINFAGTTHVTHPSGIIRTIYVPGTRTYDPAGKTGDPHASERIGPSCSRTQCAITLVQMVAACHGATVDQLIQMQEALCPLVTRYHGRLVLFDWMLLQIREAIFENKDVTPYPEYIKKLMASDKLKLDDISQRHTRDYLQYYNANQAKPPLEYYKKVAVKDKIDELLQGEDLETFRMLTTQ